MLGARNRPVDRETHRAPFGQLGGRVLHHRIGEPFRIKSPIMEQTGDAFGGSFLMGKTSGSLRLTGGLLLDDRAHNVGQAIELMPVCPWHETCDILAETRGVSVLSWHAQILSREPRS